MADRYWVGGTATWDTTTTANWSATSGGTGGASVPTSADNVFFDQTGPYTVTLSGTLNCRDITFIVGSAVSLSVVATPTLNIYGSMTLASDTTVSGYSGAFIFLATTAQTITPSGKTFNANLTFSGVGGSWQLQGNLFNQSSRTATLTAGTLDLNGYTLTIGLFSSNNSNVRTLAFGSTGLLQLTGSGTSWNTTTATNLTTTGSQQVSLNLGTSAMSPNFGSPTEANAVSVAVTGSVNNLTISGSVKTLDFTGFSKTSNLPAKMYGSLILSATMTLTSPNAVFEATSGNWVLQTNGKALGTVTFGAGSGNSTATWDLQDALSNGTNVIYINTGTLNTNNYAITCGGFQSSSTQTRTINLGSTAMAIGVNGFYMAYATGLTFNAGTSVISITGAGANLNAFAAGMTFYDVAFTSTANTTSSILGANTYNNLSIAGRLGAGTAKVIIYHNQTVNGTLTLSAGASVACRTFLLSSVLGTQRTISVASFAAGSSGIDFQDIAITGAAAPIAPASAGNCGNNSGITFPAARTLYWNYVLSTGWNNLNAWATTSGGTPSGSDFPLAQDTAVFDNAGAAATVTIGSVTQLGSLDMSTRAVGMTLTITSTLNIYGDLAIGSGVTLTSGATFALNGPSNHNVTSAGKTISFLYFYGNGTTTLQDNLTVTNLSFYAGTYSLDINGKTTSVSTLNLLNNTSLTPANGTLTCAGVTHTWGTLTVGSGYGVTCSSVYTFSQGTITINDGAELAVAYFSSSGSSPRVLNFGTGQFTISGTNGTIWELSGTNVSYTGTFKVVTTDSSNNAKTITNPSVAGLQQDVSTAGSSGYIISAASNYRIILQGWYNNVDVSGMAVGSTLDTGTALFVYENFALGGLGTTTTSGGALTFAATSGTKTISTGGSTLNFPVTFSGVGGIWQLQGAMTVGSTRLTTLTAGTLDLNNYTLTTGQFNNNSGSVRVLAFGTGNITVNGTGSVWTATTQTNFSYTGTPTVNIANNSATATTVTTGSPSAAQALDFNYTTGTYTLTDASAVYRSLNLTGFAGTFTNQARTCYGDFNVGSTATLSAGANAQTFAATSGTKTITTNGRTLDFPLTFNGIGGTWQLQDALTSGAARTATLTNGTLDLNGFTFTTGLFSSSGSTARTIAFGTGNITLNGTGTVWNTATVTNFSRTGTPTVNVSNNSATATTVTTGTLTEAQALDFNYTVGTYTLTDNSAVYRSVNLTGFSGTFASTTRTYYGGVNFGTTATLSAGSFVSTFAATSGVWDIQTNGRTVNMWPTFAGVGGTWRLLGALTTASDARTTLTNGTLDLNGYSFTTGQFTSDLGSVRAIAFGSGNITVVTTTTSTLWSSSDMTGFSRTGTPTVNISRNSATAATVVTGSPTEAQALDFNYTTGTYTLTDTGARYRTLNLTGFSGTFANNLRVYYGGFNAGSTATMTSGANAQTFSATSGTWGITTNGRTLNFPITLNGVGATWQLQDNFTAGSTSAFTLTNGTLDINSKTTSVGVFTINAGTHALANGTLACASVSHTSGDLSVGTGYNISTTGTYTFTAGTLTINDGVAMPVGAFSSSNSNVRTIAFGTGQISLTGNAATVWDNSTATNFSYTGTFKVAATYTGATGTRVFNQGGTEATAQSVSTTGSSGFILDTSSTDIKALSGSWNNFDMTGVTGTLSNTARTIYGNFNAGSTVTLTAGATATTFAATSGTKTITTNGRTLDFPLAFNGVGGTWQLQDALTNGTSRTITLTNGTFNANNFNVTTGTMYSSSTNVRTLALGSGTWTVAGTGTAWNFATSTNATITGTATISMTGATAKTFAGGNLTWPTLNQGGAGALTISGNNTFTNITSTYTSTGACTITLPASGTQTLTNLTAGGTAGKLLTLNSSTNGTRSSLVINSDTNLSFVSLRDNQVSGGFQYNALQTNGNVNAGNNFGWVFSLGGGSFISFF